MAEQKKKSLSASSLKSFDTCTWLYFCQYELKLPQSTNDGALRGTIVHLIFELLLNKRHRHHYDKIMHRDDIAGSPAIRRLVIKKLKEVKILSPDNYELCNRMILVGLKTDFYGKETIGTSVSEPEFRFELENENPKYVVRGFIDKMIYYPNGNIKIVDYKSSKAKFSGDDLTANIQAMTYSLVGYKVFDADDVSVEFIFLRYPKQPLQQVHPTKDQLKGFEEYLAYMYDLILNFDEKRAKSNMAAYNDKNKWLCKAGKWICPYYNGFDYYAVVDEKNKNLKTSFNKKDLVVESGQKIVKKRYSGCPCWTRQTGKL